MPEIFDFHDGCGFVTPTLSVYYGSRDIDPESEEWTFTIKNNKGKILFQRTNSELLVVANGESPKDLLIAGLSLWL